MITEKVTVRVDGRDLTLTNLTKVLYPACGFTKAEVIDYYSRIAPVMLPHLRDRPLTTKRYPNGVEGRYFFEKNAPAHLPDWVPTARVPTPGGSKNREAIDYALVRDLPTLIWYANLAALEFHLPMWRVDARCRPADPDILVLDLDPGAPATIVECARVACLLRAALDAEGPAAYPKTSGRKGMQLYVPWDSARGEPWTYAKALARRMEHAHPDAITSVMTKKERPGKVFIDWSQNNPAKTTVAPYSLRAGPEPTVSTPLMWGEVETCTTPEDLVFTAPEVLERVGEHGDLFGPLAP